jgi:hypothetical protein
MRSDAISNRKVSTDQHTMPLVLLAGVAHPQRRIRERLLARLDDLIVSRQPFVSLRQARDHLAEQHGTTWEPFDLDPGMRDLAVRLVCLLFARRTRRHYKRWLRVVCPSEVYTDGVGLLVRHPPLRSGPARPPYTDTPPRNRHGCHLHVGTALERIALFNAPRPPLRVRCRVAGGLSLELEGAINWGHPRLAETHGLIAGRTPGQMGLAVERPEADRLRLCATTPESIIQLSACLVRGETMVLPVGSSFHQNRRVVVGLRDFEGDETELPAILSEQGDENWLTGLPAGLEMELSGAERAAIARWAYVPNGWLSPELARDLLPAEGELLPA